MVKAVSGGVKSVFILIAGTIITTGVSAQRIPIQYADNASDLMQIIKSNKLVAIMFFEAENEGVRKAVIDAASKEKVSSMEPPLTFVELKNLGAGNPVGINFSPSLKVVTNDTMLFHHFHESHPPTPQG
ncbi:hypothetical protein AAMO2058_001082900 [Amorphochlora amoebiformis]